VEIADHDARLVEPQEAFPAAQTLYRAAALPKADLDAPAPVHADLPALRDLDHAKLQIPRRIGRIDDVQPDGADDIAAIQDDRHGGRLALQILGAIGADPVIRRDPALRGGRVD